MPRRPFAVAAAGARFAAPPFCLRCRARATTRAATLVATAALATALVAALAAADVEEVGLLRMEEWHLPLLARRLKRQARWQASADSTTRCGGESRDVSEGRSCASGNAGRVCGKSAVSAKRAVEDRHGMSGDGRECSGDGGGYGGISRSASNCAGRGNGDVRGGTFRSELKMVWRCCDDGT